MFLSWKKKSYIISNPKKNEIYLDATFGAGGHTHKILKHAQCNVIAIDIDPNAYQNAQKLQKKFKKRLTFIQQNFANIQNVLNQCKITKVNGILLDLGISSMQIDQSQRGFSFQKNGPLDMRMNQKNEKQKNAENIINQYNEKQLANIFYRFGEEKNAKIIAQSIIRERKKNPIKTTMQLSQIIQQIYPGKTKINPATKCFQALRIYINDELQNLKTILDQSEKYLYENGRLIVISFHSLEDRMVKQFLNKKIKPKPNPSRYLPHQSDLKKQNINPTFKLIFKKPIIASNQEIRQNPRARSAKLRAAIRINSQNINAQNNNYKNRETTI